MFWAVFFFFLGATYDRKKRKSIHILKNKSSFHSCVCRPAHIHICLYGLVFAAFCLADIRPLLEGVRQRELHRFHIFRCISICVQANTETFAQNKTKRGQRRVVVHYGLLLII